MGAACKNGAVLADWAWLSTGPLRAACSLAYRWKQNRSSGRDACVCGPVVPNIRPSRCVACKMVHSFVEKHDTAPNAQDGTLLGREDPTVLRTQWVFIHTLNNRYNSRSHHLILLESWDCIRKRRSRHRKYMSPVSNQQKCMQNIHPSATCSQLKTNCHTISYHHIVL